jgi:hypothetical protein
MYMSKKKTKATRLSDGSAFARVRIPTSKERQAFNTMKKISVNKDHQLLLLVDSAMRIADSLEAINKRQQLLDDSLRAIAQIGMNSITTDPMVKKYLSKILKHK